MSEGLKADLGRGEFLSWFCELNAVEEELIHTRSHLKKYMKEVSVDTPVLIGPGISKIVYEPLGVVLVMGSWNFPYYTTIAPLIAVIAAGNCAVIKPSENSPNCCRKIKKLITLYLDSGSYVCVEGGVQVGISLTQKKFDFILFTGGSEIGKKVAGEAAKNLVPCMLELGGKCPAIIDESANLEVACAKIV